jgi:hypothetical protein
MDFLVQYGLGAFLGRFRAATPFARADRVVLQTPRGLELGTVLEACSSSASLAPSGAIARAATSADEAHALMLQQRTHALLAEAQTLADALHLPLTFLDAEFLFDERTAILQAIHWAECNADALFAELSQRHGVTVTLHDLTTPTPAPEHDEGGCSSCGSKEGGCTSCGTAGGGCSSGSCASGQVKSSAEMTAYFAALRQQMEAAKNRVPLH